jgi:tRNA dimethylallyltransferase
MTINYIMDKILVICGPTASGKTKTALNLAKKFNGEIISADSRQIYQEMDIGTGKDLPEKKPIYNLQFSITFRDKKYNLFPYSNNEIPIWMYDVIEPDAEFSVAHYQKFTRAVITGIINRGKLPIITGGTGYYVESLISPPETINIPPDFELRKNIQDYDVISLQILLKSLSESTWNSLNNSDKNNSRRLIRKIEIIKSNINVSQKRVDIQKFDTLKIGLNASTQFLNSKINDRVDERVKSGIEREINKLVETGYSWNLSSFNALGYREWQEWFEKPYYRSERLKQQIISTWKFHEHAYARRQMTWFKKQPDINWFDIEKPEFSQKVTEAVQSWYTKK